MSSVSISHSKDIVSFCGRRNSLLLANQEMKKHEVGCLSVEKRVHYDECLKDGNYIPVIAAIWRDKVNRLDFLKSHSAELHAPLMCEEAIALFVANPTEQTFYEVSYPLLDAACWRVLQDSMCLSDKSCTAASGALRMIYKEALAVQVTKYLQTDITTLMKKDFSRVLINAMNKTKVVAQATLVTSLPSPAWVEAHGLVALLRPAQALRPDYEALRRQTATDFLASVDQQLQDALEEVSEALSSEEHVG